MNDLYEVHTHLYGCLDEDDLNWLGSRKPPRWHIYKNSYFNIYKKYPNLEPLFKNRIFHYQKLNEQQKNILRSYYIYDNSKPTGFLHFQLCFDFIIALSHTDPEELKEISQRVSYKQKEYYSEYRMMFNPRISPNEFKEKVLALIEGFSIANKNNTKISKLIISLNREYPNYEWQYEILKDIQKKDPDEILIGIDFAGYEENDPPINKKSFIEKVIKDKQFVFLYHVGESFQNKTPSSTIRWIFQVYQWGIHRLGHATCLALTEKLIKNKFYREHAKERIDHLNFLIELYDSGEKWIPINYVQKEKKKITDNNQILNIIYENKELQLHLYFWNYIINNLKQSAIIESCPTSNIRIAGFSPLSFFEKHQFTICLGADDPGILNTSLEKEFQIAQNIVSNPEFIKQIKINNKKYCSMNLFINMKKQNLMDSLSSS